MPYRFVEEEDMGDVEDNHVAVTELPLRDLTIKRCDSGISKGGGKLFVRLRVVPGCLPG